MKQFSSSADSPITSNESPWFTLFLCKRNTVSSCLILRWNVLFDRVYSDYLNNLFNLVLSQIPNICMGQEDPLNHAIQIQHVTMSNVPVDLP
jgi:hypothetical protein